MISQHCTVCVILLTLLMIGCDANHSSEHDVEIEEGHSDHEGGNTVTLTLDQVRTIGLQLGSVEKKQLTTTLKANGLLKVPNQNRAKATAILGGIVRTIMVQPGSTVKRGQAIATIANTAVIALQEESISVASKVVLAELEYERQKELQAGNASAKKFLQQSEAELRSLKARRASLAKQLELVGINSDKLTSENISSVVNITSPITGSISNVHATIGSYVEANIPIAEIIDNSQLHLDLFVYERDLSRLKVGQIIHFTLTNNPGEEYDARIFGIGSSFEQNSKAVAVHASVQGRRDGLIDGMSITAVVSLHNANVDAVPSEAIVSYQGNDYMYVVVDSSVTDSTITYERVIVRKGTTDVGYSEITPLSDMPSNARVVTKGAFFILAKQTNSGEHEH